MARVLVVDDQDDVRSLLARLLARDGHRTTTASESTEARAQLRHDRFELVLCDVNMPGESGFELARWILAEHSSTAVVIVSGVDDPDLAADAVELGAYGYVVKPFKACEIPIAVANALRRRRLEVENRAHQERLEELVEGRTKLLRSAIDRLERQEDELQRSREETITRLARAAESRSHETGRHIERVGLYSRVLADRLGLDDAHCELIRIASPLHDVGKIGIPDNILLKPESLTGSEQAIMRSHAELGYRILAGSREEMLELAASLARTHHERFDGTGYPQALRGEEIPLEGRITAVADVFDALTSHRVYRPAVGIDDSVRIMLAGRGTQFDPRVLDRFFESLDEVVAIRDELADEPLPAQLRIAPLAGVAAL